MNFEVKFLKEAEDFLDSMDEKAREKLVYNIEKASRFKDVTVFKKLKNTEIWEFRALIRGIQYLVCLLFGIRIKKRS